jgi:hypothetical protein
MAVNFIKVFALAAAAGITGGFGTIAYFIFGGSNDGSPCDGLVRLGSSGSPSRLAGGTRIPRPGSQPGELGEIRAGSPLTPTFPLAW